ncbi:hypothetical protein PV439_43960, partial [Streptomyces scabiei]|nr:hypothetical protein [Streptomyces scabiei]
MHKLRRHALVTALSAITVATLLATGCSTESPATGDRAAATTAETPEPAAAGEQLAVGRGGDDGELFPGGGGLGG